MAAKEEDAAGIDNLIKALESEFNTQFGAVPAKKTTTPSASPPQHSPASNHTPPSSIPPNNNSKILPKSVSGSSSNSHNSTNNNNANNNNNNNNSHASSDPSNQLRDIQQKIEALEKQKKEAIHRENYFDANECKNQIAKLEVERSKLKEQASKEVSELQRKLLDLEKLKQQAIKGEDFALAQDCKVKILNLQKQLQTLQSN